MADHPSSDDHSTYLTIFNNLPTPVALVDTHGKLQAANPAWASLFDPAVLPNAGKKWLQPDLKAFVCSPSTEQFTEKAVNDGDSTRFFKVCMRKLSDQEVLVLLDEITREKTLEIEMEETTIWFREMFNAMDEAVFFATPDGRIVDANPAARQVFGYTEAELKEQTTQMLHVDEENFQSFYNQIRSSLEKGDHAILEYPAKRKSGDIFPAKINIALLKKPDQSPLGILSVVWDVSAEKKAEEATRESERFQGALELAGAVCHDMNQPLMAISGYAELLLMDCPPDSPLADRLTKLSEQVKKMGDITQKVMRVTRYETKTYMDQQIIDIDRASSS